jgi:coenzyme F420-0:L-glutamate ligase/coenzyme F420-1:gamma-L-glutamate ligase
MMFPEIKIIGLTGIPVIRSGDSLTEIILVTAQRQGVKISDGDVIVITQKIISKAEGRLINLDEVSPSSLALEIAKQTSKDPRYVDVILKETKNIIKITNKVLIMETKHGFVCANAGVDRSNVSKHEIVALLPKNPDESARQIRNEIKRKIGVEVAVIISDTFGRPWREGHINVAVGVAGMKPITDYRGKKDMFGYILKVTTMAIADELASAAELVMGKTDGIPVAILKGFKYPKGEGTAKELVRPMEKDLFR